MVPWKAPWIWFALLTCVPERILLRDHGEIGDGKIAEHFQVDLQFSHALLAIKIRFERQGEIRFHAFDGNPLRVLQLQALCAVRQDRDNAGGKRRGHARAFRFFFLLQKPRIDLLHLDVFVEFGGAFALQDDAGDAHHAVPHGEIRNGRVAGDGENVLAFQPVARVIAEDLHDADARILVVEAHVDAGFVQGERGRFRLLGIAGNEHSHVPEGRRNAKANEDQAAY